jgi:hypothetical protein
MGGKYVAASFPAPAEDQTMMMDTMSTLQGLYALLDTLGIHAL